MLNLIICINYVRIDEFYIDFRIFVGLLIGEIFEKIK